MASWQPQQQPQQPQRWFSNGGDDDGDDSDISSSPVTNTDYNVQDLMDSFVDTSYYAPVQPDFDHYAHMTNEELKDTSTIPGWEFIHSPAKDKERIPRGALVGTVVSTKMQKTVNVSVDRYKVHPKYRKRTRFTRKFMAHDDAEVASPGDLVMIAPCHRISKQKHFMLREIIRAKGQL
jgi:small subunit ribosomal protein S17